MEQNPLDTGPRPKDGKRAPLIPLAPPANRLVSQMANLIGILIALVAIYLIFLALTPETFLRLRTIEAILLQTTVVGIAALGMTLVIIAGGIDLSVGSIIALSTVVVAWALARGVGPLYAALLGIGAGALCGTFNGVIIAWLRVVPFIVTLGSLLILRGLAKGLAGEQKIDAPETWLENLMASVFGSHGGPLLPWGVWILILMAILVAVMLMTSTFGRHLFALGSNERAAFLSGVPVARMKIAVYTLSGAFAGLAGVMQFSRLTVGDPTTSVGAELDVIAAVVIGGGSLAGGEGSIVGTLIGALIMTVIDVGGTHVGLPNWVQETITGGIIILAIALDRLRHRRVG